MRRDDYAMPRPMRALLGTHCERVGHEVGPTVGLFVTPASGGVPIRSTFHRACRRCGVEWWSPNGCVWWAGMPPPVAWYHPLVGERALTG